MSYQKLDVVQFGRELIDSGDLDPVYVMLHGAGLDRDILRRWLLAHLLFYHPGVASRAAEPVGTAFHDVLAQAQREMWPRGSERRHFRGAAADKALAHLRKWFPRPERAIEHPESAGTFGEVTRRMLAWPGFGPWAIFKAADLIERVLGAPIDFTGCEAAWHSSPVAGAKLAYPGVSVPAAAARLLEELGPLRAPPGFDRVLGVTEAETVFCKFGSHMKGNYPLGKDSRELFHNLAGWGPLAERLRQFVPNRYLSGGGE